MSVSVRPASLADTRQMSEIAGGDAVSPQALADWMDDGAAYAAWHVAEDNGGCLVGFQRIGACADVAGDTCEIATFLREGAPLAVGSQLFAASARAARLLGYAWIDATIAAANETAQIYYQSRGFRRLRVSTDQHVMRFEID